MNKPVSISLWEADNAKEFAPILQGGDILPRDGLDGDVVDIELVLADQEEEQVERPLKDG